MSNLKIDTSNSVKLKTSLMSAGLVAAYSLAQVDLKSSSVIADMSGNAYHGTITPGTGAFTTDKNGQANKAYNFDGANTTIETSLTSNADFQNGFTLSAWIKPAGAGEGNLGKVLDKSTSNGGVNGFTWGFYTTTTQFYVNINAIEPIVVSTVGYITLGQWNHILVTVASNGAVVHYFNDVNVGGGASGAVSGITTANPLTIGNRSTATDRNFNGPMCNIKVIKGVASAQMISFLASEYNSALKITP